MTLTDLTTLLVTAILIGLSAAAIPPFVRAIPLVQVWMMQGRKPWVCDLCMSFWSTLLASGVACFMGAPAVAGIPAWAVTFFIVRKNSDPIGPPPGMPELVDSAQE